MSDPTPQRAVLQDFDPHNDSGPVPSPCISVCIMAPDSGLCTGCWRTIEEIMQWSTADDQLKRSVWVEIKRRQAAQFD